MSWVELIGFLIFFIVIVVLGTWHNKRVHALSDYVVSGRSLNSVRIVGAILSTWIGAGTILGLSSEVYKTQSLQPIIAVPLACSLGLILLGYFGSSRIRSYNCYTVCDIIDHHYGKAVSMIFAVLMALQYVGMVGAQFKAMGYFFFYLTGQSVVIGSLICAFCVGIYVHRGGLWSLVMTDLVQVKAIALMAIVSMFVIVIAAQHLSLSHLSDVDFAGIAPPSLSASGYEHSVYWGNWLMGIAAAALGQDIFQRILAAKSDRVAIFGTCLAALIFALICIVPILVGLVSKGLLPETSDAQRVFPLFIERFGSKPIYFLFNLGLIATFLSSADSMLLAGSSLLARNVALKIFAVGEDNEVPLVRICNIIVIMLAFATSLSYDKFYGLIVYGSSVMLVACLVPLFAAIFIPSTPFWPAMISSFVGFGVWISYLLVSIPEIASGTLDEAVVSAAAFYGFCGASCAFPVSWFLKDLIQSIRRIKYVAKGS